MRRYDGVSAEVDGIAENERTFREGIREFAGDQNIGYVPDVQYPAQVAYGALSVLLAQERAAELIEGKSRLSIVSNRLHGRPLLNRYVTVESTDPEKYRLERSRLNMYGERKGEPVQFISGQKGTLRNIRFDVESGGSLHLRGGSFLLHDYFAGPLIDRAADYIPTFRIIKK